MNPKGLRQLYRLYQTRDTSDTNCQFEVTDEGESGLEMTYDSTAAFSCVTTVGSPSCVSTCSMYQGTDDWMDEVRIPLTRLLPYTAWGHTTDWTRYEYYVTRVLPYSLDAFIRIYGSGKNTFNTNITIQPGDIRLYDQVRI